MPDLKPDTFENSFAHSEVAGMWYNTSPKNLTIKVNFVKPTFVRIIAYMEELPLETGRMTTISATVIALLAPLDPVVKRTHVPR